jgi:hypothetical protein
MPCQMLFAHLQGVVTATLPSAWGQLSEVPLLANAESLIPTVHQL